LERLRENGVNILNEVPAKASGTIIIRAHGVPPNKKKMLEELGARVEDATCPRVMKVQAIIGKYKNKGYSTVIIGDLDHAEVEGLMGFTGSSGQVVSNDADIDALKITPPYIIVSQTTQDQVAFDQLKDKILSKYPGGKVFNTICDSTHKRQEEVRQLCGQVEAMVVVGGKTSANTQRLGHIAEGLGCPVFVVETYEDLDLAALKKHKKVGITAGASTPNWVISKVVEVITNLTD
jgi:4-hydroxy-3-methylbut-2-enyl diphosphate reductase